MSAVVWLFAAVVALAAAVLGYRRLSARADADRAASLGITPLTDLMDGPQLGDDTLAMVAEDPAEKAAARFTRVGWIEEPPGSGYWIKDADTTPEQRHEARKAYDRRALLADDECPLEDIALDADALLFMAEVLADIDDQPTYTEGAES